MNDYIKIKNHPDLVKDSNSGAILNIDNNALDQYRIKRSKKIIEEKRLNKIENEMYEIKNMMIKILEEIKK